MVGAGSIQVSDKSMQSWYKLLVLTILFTSCGDSFREVEEDLGYDFFPLEVGAYWQYDVMQVEFDASGPDTSYFELRNTIVERNQDSNQDFFILMEETRGSESDPWSPANTWTMRRDAFTGVVVEENIPFIKMTFPVIEGGVWDGNAYNTLGFSEYEYREAPEAAYDELIGGAAKILVQISDIPKNLVNQDQRLEVYARGIGLVEKNYIILNFCTSNCGSEEIDSGTIIEQVLTAYGKE